MTSQAEALGSFSHLGYSILPEAPEQSGSGGDLDEAIHPKSDKGDASGKHACEHAGGGFQAIVSEAYVLETARFADEQHAVTRAAKLLDFARHLFIVVPLLPWSRCSLMSCSLKFR